MSFPVQGAGLGLRRTLLPDLLAMDGDAVDFLELAPENWIGIGGRLGRQFRRLADRFPLVCHGLSLSLGSPAALDTAFLRQVKAFLDHFEVLAYNEHLSYCSDEQGHLYDLMPIPFTGEAVEYVAGRIRQVQDCSNAASASRTSPTTRHPAVNSPNWSSSTACSLKPTATCCWM